MSIYKTIRKAMSKAVLGAAFVLPVFGGCYAAPQRVSETPQIEVKQEAKDLKTELAYISSKTGISYEKVVRLYLDYMIQKFKDNAKELDRLSKLAKEAQPLVDKSVEGAKETNKDVEEIIKGLEDMSLASISDK